MVDTTILAGKNKSSLDPMRILQNTRVSSSRPPTTLEFHVLGVGKKIQATNQQQTQSETAKDHRSGTELCKIHGHTYMEFRSGNGGAMGGGAVLSLSAMR